MIEEEIEKTLIKIKNVIETSLKEVQNINLDGLYLKRHFINICESQINLYISEDKNQTDNFIDNNMIQIEDIKNIEENYYKEKIYDILINYFRLSIEDYYSQYYNYEISKRINYYYCYFDLILQYSIDYIKNKFDYLYSIAKNKNRFDNSTFQNIKYLPDKLVNIISKLFEENKFYINNTYIKDF